MDDHDRPNTNGQPWPDQLTGLETLPHDGITPVRVEVLAEDPAAGVDADPAPEHDQDPNPTLEALRRSIATAEERLSSERELRQQLEASQEEVRRLEVECDNLRAELAQARNQLTEVASLQRQLQSLLEQT